MISLRSFVPGRDGALALALLAAVARLAAQDVILTPPAWREVRDAPSELPVLKNPPRVEFPAELKQTPDLGYVVFDVQLDGKGRLLEFSPHGTLAAYERVAHLSQLAWNWSPGRRDGKGVNTETVFAVIFNPASAGEKTPDATPRLLEVALVQLPRPKGAKESDVFPDQVVMADVGVDETGAVTVVKNVSDGLARALAIAAKNWRFAPARREGKPVAAEMRAPFVIVTGEAPRQAGAKLTQPRVTFQARPVYPWAMRANGMRGKVIVDFIVDIEGRVRNAFVVRSLNPSFDDPAIEAVRKWRFDPGRIGERPVNTHMQVPVIFTLDGTGEGGEGPITQTKKPDLSKLPEQFRYDTPPRPTGTVRPVYPYALLRAKKEGKASVGYVVNDKGRVVQADIREATAPELGRALQAAIECFGFEPALKGGRPGPAVLAFSQQFNRDAGWLLVDDDDVALLRREEKKPETILALSELDAVPAPRSRGSPRFPLSVKPEVTTGEAVIEFLIDEDGRVRLPRVVSASEEAFGYAAVQGVAAWRFEPPKRGDRPVVTRVQIPISFGESASQKK